MGKTIGLKEGELNIKRVNHLYEKLIDEKNLRQAILVVCDSHKYHRYHNASGTLVKYVNQESLELKMHTNYYVKQLKEIIEGGFEPSPMKHWVHYDKNAKKYRNIAEPKLWPDQCVHHALIQVLTPVIMKNMDYWCCGSIPGRGQARGVSGIKSWMKNDKKGTKYCLSLDIRHFYETLSPKVSLADMKSRIKDYRLLNVIERVTQDGFIPGAYHAQWFANSALQPLDNLIRKQDGVKHYIRYMDNFTIFGSNKRKLRKIKENIEKWLNQHGLKVKGDWQIFNTWKRRPYAMGYTYGHGYTMLAKASALRLKRQISKYKYKLKHHKEITFEFACGLLSRLSLLTHCNSYQFYKYCVPHKLARQLKEVVRNYMRKINKNRRLECAYV